MVDVGINFLCCGGCCGCEVEKMLGVEGILAFFEEGPGRAIKK
jgi:hypothetical protein